MFIRVTLPKLNDVTVKHLFKLHEYCTTTNVNTFCVYSVCKQQLHPLEKGFVPSLHIYGKGNHSLFAHRYA